jgi:hypothetical protein
MSQQQIKPLLGEGASGAQFILTTKTTNGQHESPPLFRDGQLGGLTLIVPMDAARTTLARRTDGFPHDGMSEDSIQSLWFRTSSISNPGKEKGSSVSVIRPS